VKGLGKEQIDLIDRDIRRAIRERGWEEVTAKSLYGIFLLLWRKDKN